MKVKQILATVAISGATAFGVIFGYAKLNKTSENFGGQSLTTLPNNYKFADFDGTSGQYGGPADFTAAAEASMPTVVHIVTKTNARKVSNNLPRSRNADPFSDLFDQLLGGQGGRGGGMTREQQASGSGVIISQDGYIVTNNHVVEGADEVTVTLSNRRNYTAKVIGRDPAYDLAVIKVDAKDLPYIVYGNSDNVKVGQWVLAIGYPLNLEATVTAGIISAKARSLGLNKDSKGTSQGAVESFLQTDAAVNRGNSGGALINTEGLLIGINSAIASPTGFYSGYSYAIPVNIAKKVVDDIIKYGTVQRAYLGLSYNAVSTLTSAQKEKAGIKQYASGIYIGEVSKDGGAYEAGLRSGDILKSVSGVNVETGAELNEIVSRYKPGDKVQVSYLRQGQEFASTVTLKNISGTYDIVKTQTAIDKLGGEFLTLDAKTAKAYGVGGGVILKKIAAEGAINDQTGMKENFVILKVNNVSVKTVEEFAKEVARNKSISFTGFFPGYDGLYDYQLDLGDD